MLRSIPSTLEGVIALHHSQSRSFYWISGVARRISVFDRNALKNGENRAALGGCPLCHQSPNEHARYSRPDRTEHARADNTGGVVDGSGHAWVAREVMRLAQQSARGRTAAAAAEAAALDSAIYNARARPR